MAIRPLIGAGASGLQKSSPIAISKVPPVGEGPRMFVVDFDFTTTQQVVKTYQLRDLGLSMVQCLYIDNTLGTNFVSFNINGFNYSCAPSECVYTPLLITGDTLQINAYSASAVIIRAAFLNVLVPAFQSLPSFAQIAPNEAGTNVFIANFPLDVTPHGGSFNVTGQFYQTIQPVSISASINVNIQNSFVPVTAKSDAQISALGISVPTVIKIGSGRLWFTSITQPGTSSGLVCDSATTAGANVANAILPTTAALISFNIGGVPFTNGLTVIPGAGQTIMVAYTN